MEKFAAWPVDAFVRVCAEIVALRLQQIGRQSLGTITVEIVERSAHRRYRDAVHRSVGHDASPTCLSRQYLLFEERVKQQVGEVGMLIERLFDFSEESRTDDASPALHQGDAAIVQLPSVCFGGFAHQGIALSI